MTFLEPGRLWLLALLLILIGTYLYLQTRRRSYALRFTNLSLLDQVAPKRPAWRRHIPAALFLLTIAALIVGTAQPSVPVQVPRERATIMVAIDVSNSMDATDVSPNRFDAAKDAAQNFIDQLPPRFNVGLVAFDGTARIINSPTDDRAAVQASIENLRVGPATAIGEAVFASLQAIQTFDEQAQTDPPPAAIVLLSDGENTAGRPIPMAIRAAQDAETPVSTIAFGTDHGYIELDDVAMPVRVNREALASIAERTGGTAHEAESATELHSVYADIGTSLGYETEQQDVTARLVWIALILALATATTSLLWFQRIP
ncbi:VWA domain-containing protein [Allonocardiopsis opalescens]|nr:VWA domain-containing protein [Allonocardiopsis opalescens]